MTGASKGIGAAIALRMAAEGWFCLIHYFSDQRGAKVVLQTNAARGGLGMILQADLADSEQISRLFQ